MCPAHSQYRRDSLLSYHPSTHQSWLTAAGNIPPHSRSLRGGLGRSAEWSEEAAWLRRSTARGPSLWLSLHWDHSWATLRPSLIVSLTESGYYWPPAPSWRLWGAPCLGWSLYCGPDSIWNVLSSREWWGHVDCARLPLTLIGQGQPQYKPALVLVLHNSGQWWQGCAIQQQSLNLTQNYYDNDTENNSCVE